MYGRRSRLLHHIFQRTGLSPDAVMDKPRFVRTFLLKSMEVQLEEEAEQAAAMERRRRELAARPRGRR